MKSRKLGIKVNDNIYKMLKEIVEERNNTSELLMNEHYTMSDAVREGIFYTHAIFVSRKYDLVPKADDNEN